MQRCFSCACELLKAKAGIKNLGKDIQEAAKKLDEAMKEE